MRIRLATYNVENLSDRISPARRENLRAVVASLDADVLALQEVEDRRALHGVLNPRDWTLIIDDDSPGRHDLALAIRRACPLRPDGFLPSDLDADDVNFLFCCGRHERLFLDGRDVLHVRLNHGDGSLALHVLVHHATSRRAGRASTDRFRTQAARLLANVLAEGLADEPTALVGDFNDTPDDRSVNVLETGDVSARAGTAAAARRLMVNLTEPLWAEGHATLGVRQMRLDPNSGRVRTWEPGRRERHLAMAHREGYAGPGLFDQILASPALARRHVAGSTRVLDDPILLRGGDSAQASDHLPVYADFEV